MPTLVQRALLVRERWVSLRCRREPDLAGGDDPSCRPNQLLAISLAHPVLEQSRWQAVVDIAKDKLVTPLELRTLSLDNPDFRPTYHGDFKTRDAAYHQGTVWAWLIGPFITPGQGRQLGVEAGGRGSHRPARQPTARDDGNVRTTPAPVRAA